MITDGGTDRIRLYRGDGFHGILDLDRVALHRAEGGDFQVALRG
jgi:hypothetical protein